MPKFTAIVVACLSASSLAAQAQPAESLAYVMTSARLCAQPVSDSDTCSVAHLAGATPVRFSNCKKGWCQVVANGRSGYLPRLKLWLEPLPWELMRTLAFMQTDLRKLVTAEEVFFADRVRYTKNLRPLTTLPQLSYIPSPGVTVSVDTMGHDGYRASVRRPDTPGWTCEVFIGDVVPHLPHEEAGIPVCWKSPSAP